MIIYGPVPNNSPFFFFFFDLSRKVVKKGPLRAMVPQLFSWYHYPRNAMKIDTEGTYFIWH